MKICFGIMGLILSFIPLSVRADDLIAYDSFSGDAFGWSGDWSDGDNSNTFELSVRDVELIYEDDCGIQILGGDTCLKATSTRSGNQSKFISRDVEGLNETFYVSCLVQFSPEPKNKWWYAFTSWNYFAIGKKDNDDDSGVLMGTAYTAWKLGAAFCQNGSSSKYVDIVGSQQPTLNKTYMIVGKWVCNSSGVITNITLWINPNSLTSESAEYTVSTSYSPDDEMTSVDLQSYFGGTTYMDEIRVGYTWESVVSSIVPTHYYYSGGTGTEDDPFIIANKEDLLDLTSNSDDWDKYFLQTANIIFDADSSQVDWNWDGDVDSDDDSGFSPIGSSTTKFTGTYDGQGYRIKNLFVNRSINGVGLFGCCSGATIQNVQLAKVKIYGAWNIGAIAGSCSDECSVENCFSSGYVEGSGPIGGLIGSAENSSLVQSYSLCDVVGQYQTGGLVGILNGASSLVKDCFSRGDAKETYSVGGLVGQQANGDVENSYSTGSVSGVDYGYGGLIGYYGGGGVNSSYWDTEASACSSSGAGEGKTTEEMKLQSTFSDWDFGSVWAFNEKYNEGYPYLLVLEESFAMQLTEFVEDGVWTDEDGWTNGVPDDETALAIISGSCEVEDNVVVPAIEVASSGELIISETADVVSLITLESDSAGGAEYVNKNTEESTYDTVIQERYFKGGQWNFICVPVDMIADSLFVDLKMATSWGDADGEYWVVEYSQEKRANLGAGMEAIYDGNHVLESGNGYMIWVDNDQVGEYKHLVANSQSKVITQYTAGTSDDNNGWNLVGNPFTHSMSYDDVFDCSHNAKYFTGAVYVFDGEGYKVWVGSSGDEEARDIEPMEAFFVKRDSSDSESAYFCMANGDCDCSDLESKLAVVSDRITDSEYVDGLSLGVSPVLGECSDDTYLNVEKMSLTDDDDRAIKMEKSNGEKDIIYTVAGDKACAVNSVSTINDDTIAIPVVLNLSEVKDPFALRFEVLGDDDCTFYLIDEYNADTMPMVRFGEQTYSNNSDEEEISDRFSILVVKTPDIVTEMIENDAEEEGLIQVSSQDKILQVKSLTKEKLDIAVYDMSGRVICVSELLPMESYEESFADGVYVLQVRSADVTYGVKFYSK